MNKIEDFEILSNYSFIEFCSPYRNRIRVNNYYDVNDYGEPELKTRLLIGSQRVGISGSVKNLDDLFIHPEAYQILKISFRGGKPYYKVCVYKENEHDLTDIL